MTAFLFSCEYATCAVPEAYREIFRGSEDTVTSTEGWEPGSLNLAQGFAMKFRTPLVHGDVTRLLIDFEQDGDARWSRFSLKLPEATRVKVADRHQRPFRTVLHQRIAEDLRRHPSVIHIMIHTDATTDGEVRLESPPHADLAENIAAAWYLKLKSDDLDVRHFRNVITTPLGDELTARYPAHQYALIRLSVSQTFFLESRPWRWDKLKKHLLATLPEAVKSARPVSAPISPSTPSD